MTTTSPPARAATASRIWHGAIALIVLVSLIIQIALLVNGGTDVNSGEDHVQIDVVTRLVRLFSFFTIQSNLFVLYCAATLALNPYRDGRIWRIARLDALVGIVITGIVYDLVLAAEFEVTGIAWWANLGFHYIAPWATLLGWILFGPRPRITWATVGGALVWPAAWLLYTFVRGAFVDWYPYPFLNVMDLGYGTALRNTLVVVVIAGVLMVVFRLLDRFRSAVPDRP